MEKEKLESERKKRVSEGKRRKRKIKSVEKLMTRAREEASVYLVW